MSSGAIIDNSNGKGGDGFSGGTGGSDDKWIYECRVETLIYVISPMPTCSIPPHALLPTSSQGVLETLRKAAGLVGLDSIVLPNGTERSPDDSTGAESEPNDTTPRLSLPGVSDGACIPADTAKQH